MKRPEPPTAGRFRAIALSDPAYERDHLRILTFASPALGGRGDLSLFVPPGSAGMTGLPLVVLLHGGYGSHWEWFWRGGAHMTALRLIGEGRMRPMMIACPSDGLRGDGSGYIRHRDQDCEAWIVDDVMGIVGELFPETGPERVTFIAGLSMGGYGALRLGTKHAARFKGIAAHSAATRAGQMSVLARQKDSWSEHSTEELDILYWASAHKGRLPPIRFDCGRDDFLFEANQRLHADLDHLGVAHEYGEHPGGHDWPYWQTHIEDTLLFFERVMRGEKG